MSPKPVTELNYEEASSFFKEQKSYVNFDLPKYFNFENLLTLVSSLILSRGFSDLLKKRRNEEKVDQAKNYRDVNYTILDNKDGLFAWRPLQLIHPVLYIDLANTITSRENWRQITNRFKDFARSKVDCISIPRKSDTTDSHKASQVIHWWEEMEQRSIQLALDYDYVFATDIRNCYGSIYTHSIEWALDKRGKSAVKRGMRKKRKVTIGGQIDQRLQGMNYGQTNGIPQGSALMDFIAEIVLGYADILLTKKLNRIKKEDFYILRYRDDYRIFVNNPVIGHEILKQLNLVLYDLGMQMNAAKTTEGGDVILSSIKKEKLEYISTAPAKQFYQKEALRIYQFSKKYPNAGLVSKELSRYHDYMVKHSESLQKVDTEVLISIFVMIAFSSPKAINWVSTIISHLLSAMSNRRAIEIIKKIYKKFQKVPNAGYIDIWLQRISAPMTTIKYRDKLTRVATQRLKNSSIWNCSWLKEDIVRMLDVTDIADFRPQDLPRVISREEVELFKIVYN